MNKHHSYKLYSGALVLIFACLIYTPLLMGIIQEDLISSSMEKRNLATLPAPPVSLQTFIDYPQKFDAYYSDHFGYREVLTKVYFQITNKLNGTSSIDDVTIGQDGWLFLGGIRPGPQKHKDPMGDAMNVNLFSDDNLQAAAQSIQATKNWLSAKGIEYVYIIAPNKHTIYFEQLPSYITKKNEHSATDQLVSYLKKYTDVNVVDLRPALFDEKKKHPVYFKTDSHWNQYGANRAQFEIMKNIEARFPGKITPFMLDDEQFKLSSSAGGDLVSLAKTENVKEDNPEPIFDGQCVPTNTKGVLKEHETETYTALCDTKKLNAVIFRDSFFSALYPYISRQFHRSTYIWEKMNYATLVKYVEQEQPDIVIDEVVERTLPYIPLTIPQ